MSLAYSKTWVEVFIVFVRLGLTSFGGPIAHLGYFHREFVVRRAWVSAGEFSQLLVICQFLPGPASSQLGFCIGLCRAGWLGALAAFVGFTLPSALFLFAFASSLLQLSSGMHSVTLHGLKIVAFAVVAEAILGMSKKLCPDIQRRILACITVGIALIWDGFGAQVSLVLLGAIAGMLLCPAVLPDKGVWLTLSYGVKTGAALLCMFVLLLIALPILAIGDTSIFALTDIFYRAGALVFGGGHVVLPLLEQSVVTSGLVSEESFLTGYGLSQAIPGPLFAFAAYLGVLVPTGESAWVNATAALTCIFLPGFLLVAGILPFWRMVAMNPYAIKAIAGANATVVGLLAGVFYDPIVRTAILSFADLVIAIVAFTMLSFWRLHIMCVIAWCLIAKVLVALI